MHPHLDIPTRASPPGHPHQGIPDISTPPGNGGIPTWAQGHPCLGVSMGAQGHPHLRGIQPGHWAIPASTHAGSLPWLLPVCRTSQPEHLCCGLCYGTKASLLGYPFWGTPHNTYMRAQSMAQPRLFHMHQVPQLGHHGTGSLCMCRAPLWASSGTAGHLTAWFPSQALLCPQLPLSWGRSGLTATSRKVF